LREFYLIHCQPFLSFLVRCAHLTPERWLPYGTAGQVTQNVVSAEVDESAIDQPGAVAIVHDYLTQRGGAERVVLAMHRAFPAAPIYTSLYEPDLTFPEFRDVDVRPSYLNRSQFLRRHHRLALPLLAHAFSNIDVHEKIVLCSSSGWAHGIHTTGTKLVYCHCPARWLYKGADYFRKSEEVRNGKWSRTLLDGVLTSFALEKSLGAVAPILRRWDLRASASASEYYTNSSAVFDEISSVYGIEPFIIPPPHLVATDGPSEKPRNMLNDEFFLVVSRLLPYKNLDRILGVFAERPDLELVVVGSGPLEKALKQSATTNVDLLGNVRDSELRWLYGHARALIAPAFEDYGLTPLEAASFGTPTIALKKGGYLETVSEGISGYFFENLDVSSVSGAIENLIENPLNGDEILEHASRFSEERFVSTLRQQVSIHMA
jgi:glycosyltransferase involved in cell wall biosynthesis